MESVFEGYVVTSINKERPELDYTALLCIMVTIFAV